MQPPGAIVEERRDGGAGQASGGMRPRPRALIVTVLGAFVRRLGGWIAISDLIRLMEALDVDERAVRSSVSRLKRRGFLVPVRRDGCAGYTLSVDADEILAAGDRRIFRPETDGAAESWIVVVFSVPEARREHRHVLRSQLTWLGFGSAAARVWIAPAHLEEELRTMIERHSFESYVSVFRAEYAGLTGLAEAAARWWDLEALAGLYDGFLTLFAPMLAGWQRRRSLDQADAFADYVRALTYWRRLPYLDPGLPSSVLPADWSGHQAQRLFAALHDLLAEPAYRHVVRATGGSD
jgi:phenylacetic acid degradation operon negative regulatory protein